MWSIVAWVVDPVALKGVPGAVRQLSVAAAVAILYAANNAALSAHAVPDMFEPFASGHLNDVLAPFGFLSLTNAIYAMMGHGVCRLAPTMALAALASAVWEGLAPLVFPESVSDPLDVVCYFVGAMLYWMTVGPRSAARRI